MGASQGTLGILDDRERARGSDASADQVPALLGRQQSGHGYYAAVDKGFYKDEGLDVEVVMGGPNLNPIQTVMGGATTLGQADAQAVAAARAEGLPISVSERATRRRPTR